MADPEQKAQGADTDNGGNQPAAGTSSAEGDSMENMAKATEALQKQVAELQDRLLRSQAELDNFRRRTHRDQDEARKYESLRLLHDLLPALDGLQRAVASAEQTGDMQNLLDGIRMVSQQFKDTLKAHSAEPIDALGKPFDPNLHEALSQIPMADCEPMTVVQVVEMGYRLHDRVVRPARVIVSCAPSE